MHYPKPLAIDLVGAGLREFVEILDRARILESHERSLDEVLHQRSTRRRICCCTAARSSGLGAACKRGTPCRYSSVGLVPDVLRSSLECGFGHRIGPPSLSEVLIE